MIINNIEYQFIRGSDVQRDGMYLEVNIANSNPLIQVAEVFYSDITSEFTFNCWESNVPLEIIETLIRQSKLLLPPLNKSIE
ncbi:hypothetical protein EKN56_15615 [Limnobaculum zhutongyuii]|uniref:Uncharacterized protein n=1 Tax=Limnobaculum zhutongyuii TaxID=2498113 RepID=A0A411WNH0_9GAMM|nr:hypothetical protein EKN56_15615 [Limnobaculum zhutongyuii]TQS86809.1 hypothetical protein ELQ32_17325 [Limnobaculum zhutongyuii]